MQILVGDFNEEELKKEIDKVKVEEKKKETGLKYVNTKIIKKRGEKYLRIWVCDLESFEF